MARTRVRLGVSACLLGDAVRWDGQHRRDPFVVDVLGPFVEWVPVCPELDLGLGVPREPIRLMGTGAAPRLVGERSGKDHTAAMLALAEARVKELSALDLAGYVTKKDSPSCGLERVRVYGRQPRPPPRSAAAGKSGGEGGPPRRDGVGMFVSVLRRRLPLLPIEEEGRLEDPALRESFIERVFAFARWNAARARGMTRGGLVAFHTAHKLAIMAHSPAGYRALGALVGNVARGPLARTLDAYGAGLMAALQVPATRGRHANVLQHALGHFRRLLPPEDRVELAETVADYARGLVPLVVPLTLLRHHARRHGVEVLAGQTYLDPEPKELMLRNHA